MKRFLIVVLLAVALAACTTPTPTASPIVTPTPSESPIETPETDNRVEDDARIEKPKSDSMEENTVNEIPTLLEMLTKLAGGAGVGIVISFLFERFKWFQALSGDVKWWTILGLSVGLPVAAQLLIQFVPPDVWVALQPYWFSLAVGFAGWITGQVAHRAVTSRAAK